MEQDQKDRARRLAAQLVIAEQLLEPANAKNAKNVRPLLRTALATAAGNAHSLARALSVTDDEIQAEAEALRNHKQYQS
ncbi:MAG: hypothetical protein Q8Q88_17400 [Phenylobacterium sp.]|uniref:hypothetical protein n=1 Tax=Phenylobacterium sp. TaxID=1871053 RepID=UPI002735C211|nr:hypothetical protein [Phenylobacterium sp.]MDP3748817.1 hypothetical protein [Phenylobacterium sp.]